MSNPAVQAAARPRPAIPLRTLHQWHWISSAICLAAMLLFSVTGITLNHAGQIEAKATVSRSEQALPDALRAQLERVAQEQDGKTAPLPPVLAEWAGRSFGVEVAGQDAEWSAGEAYLALPRPGGDAWLRIGADGVAEYERTDRGWIALLNDLHKGRHAGAAWSWFIDIVGVACLVFCLTGFLILKFHAARRPSTWPIVGLGLLLPAVLVLLFVH